MGVRLVGDAYRLAKIEHYLRQAEEYYQMARYKAACAVTERVFKIDPGNTSAESLKKRIAVQLSILEGRYPSLEEAGSSGLPMIQRKRKGVVLLVDQDERILVRLAFTLRRYGFEVVSASNYGEAVETMKSIKPDIIVSEVNFEDGSSGLDLFLWLRTGEETWSIPFVFLATRIHRDVLIAGKRLGVDDFLSKPVDDDVVAASVTNCLGKARRMNGSFRVP